MLVRESTCILHKTLLEFSPTAFFLYDSNKKIKQFQMLKTYNREKGIVFYLI